MPVPGWTGPARLVVLGALLAVAAWSPWRSSAAADNATAAAGPAPAPRVALPSSTVAWRPAADDADMERAFAQARAERKPLLLYWGATWCPPCNQLKATLFNRQDFGALGRGFVAVHVDGDRPGAQKLGARFQVSGYPTLLLLAADGRELTRLPGEVEPAQVLSALRAGLAGGRSAAAVLADARAGRALGAAEWRLLAYYAWDADEAGRLVPPDRQAEVLAELARRSEPLGDPLLTNRLWLKALTAGDESQGLKADPVLRVRVSRLLADPLAARAQADLISGHAERLARALGSGDAASKTAGVAALEAALARLQDDASLSRADRAGALIARVELARADQPRDTLRPELPEPLRAAVRELAARFDREIRDPHERQAVITTLAYLQGRAGLWDDSQALLKANLAKSHSPYYLMSQLGGQARRQGRSAEALDWYAQAFERSVGPATRLQWGTAYLSALVELAPDDRDRIEGTAARLLDEAARDPAAFHERSARSLARLGRKLLDWSQPGERAAVIGRLQARLDRLCPARSADDGQRAACEAVLKPRAGA